VALNYAHQLWDDGEPGKAIETLKAPAAPASAVEALKSLATALPLARVEVVPLTTISEAIASTQAAEPDIPAPAELQPPLPTTEPLPTDSEPVGAAENVAAQDAVVVVLSEPAAPSQPTDEAFAAAAPAPTAASVAPAVADALAPPDPVAAPSASVAKSDPVAEPEGAQLHPIRAEGVGLDDVGAGLQILPVHVPHEVGIAERQRLEAAVDEDTAPVQHRPHRAIADEDALGQRSQKWFHWRADRGAF